MHIFQFNIAALKLGTTRGGMTTSLTILWVAGRKVRTAGITRTQENNSITFNFFCL